MRLFCSMRTQPHKEWYGLWKENRSSREVRIYLNWLGPPPPTLTSFYAAVLERSAVAAKDAGSWSWPRYGVLQRVAVAAAITSPWSSSSSRLRELIYCLWPRTRQHEHVRSSVVCSEGESMWGCLTWAVFSPFPDPTTWAYLANVAKYVPTQRLYCYILLTKIVSGKQQEIIIFNRIPT